MQETTSRSVAASAVDPEPLFRTASGFMAAQHLFAAAQSLIVAVAADGDVHAGG